MREIVGAVLVGGHYGYAVGVVVYEGVDGRCCVGRFLGLCGCEEMEEGAGGDVGVAFGLEMGFSDRKGIMLKGRLTVSTIPLPAHEVSCNLPEAIVRKVDWSLLMVNIAVQRKDGPLFLPLGSRISGVSRFVLHHSYR